MPDSTAPSGSSSGHSDDLIAVGRILGPHGRDGAIKVKSISDVPSRFDVGNFLSLSENGSVAQGTVYQIAKSQPTGKDELILFLEGTRDRGQAQVLAGFWLCVPVSEVPTAEEGEYFHYQLIGLKVRTTEGEDLGELAEILETGSNDVYVVVGPDGDVLVPALSKVVTEIDIDGGLMVVDLPEGLR